MQKRNLKNIHRIAETGEAGYFNLSRGLSPPLTPPYVPFMAYGGFQSAFEELIERDVSLCSQPCIIHTDICGLRACYPPPSASHCYNTTP